MAPNSSSLAALLLFFCILHVVFGSSIDFSVELIHRDSPESPFHDPTSTPFSRLRAAIQRSVAQPNNSPKYYNHRLLSVVRHDIYSSIINYKFEFLMNLYLGMPPMKVLAIADTGSDLTWVQCSPCNNCYKNKGLLFNTNASSTYKILPCNADVCSSLRRDSCGLGSSCEYHYEYMDNSFVEGFLSNDTLSFDSDDGNKVHLSGILFGCTHSSNGSFSEVSVGIVGLGGGNLSLIRQLSSITENKFSYCLPLTPSNSTGGSKSSRLYLGPTAVVSGPGAMTTPLGSIPGETLYYINLERITVAGAAGKPIAVKPEQGVLGAPLQGGNMFIDSGTAVTFIDDKAMEALSKELVGLVPLPRVNVPEDIAGVIDLCFDSGKTTEETRVPDITFHFAGGAAVVLKVYNAFVLVQETTVCLAIASNYHNGGKSVFGNLSQLSYRIVYDLDARKLTFIPEGC